MTKSCIGLTGGIATGKSTVTNLLRQFGYPVLDADALVHKLQQKGEPLYEALVSEFGADILQENGELDRPRLAQVIFSSQENQDRSAQLQDRIIRQELFKARKELLLDSPILFMDIPLLYEKGFETWCDEVWLVDVKESLQLERLMKRNGYTKKQAKDRLAFQWPLAQKKALADVIIDNNGDKKALKAQIKQLLQQLEKENS